MTSAFGRSRLSLVCAFVVQGLACLFALPAGAQSSSGDALFASNKFDTARTAYTASIKANPKAPAPRIGLIRDLIRLDAWADAITESKPPLPPYPRTPTYTASSRSRCCAAGSRKPLRKRRTQP